MILFGYVFVISTVITILMILRSIAHINEAESDVSDYDYGLWHVVWLSRHFSSQN